MLTKRGILTDISRAALTAHVEERQAREFVRGNEAALKAPSKARLVEALGESTFETYRAHLSPLR